MNCAGALLGQVGGENKGDGLLQLRHRPDALQTSRRGVRLYISAQDNGSVPLTILVLSVHNGSVVFSSACLAAGCDVATANERPQRERRERSLLLPAARAPSRAQMPLTTVLTLPSQRRVCLDRRRADVQHAASCPVSNQPEASSAASSLPAAPLCHTALLPIPPPSSMPAHILLLLHKSDKQLHVRPRVSRSSFGAFSFGLLSLGRAALSLS